MFVSGSAETLSEEPQANIQTTLHLDSEARSATRVTVIGITTAGLDEPYIILRVQLGSGPGCLTSAEMGVS